MLDLNKLEQKLEKSLENETTDSLSVWLQMKRSMHLMYIHDLKNGDKVKAGYMKWLKVVDYTTDNTYILESTINGKRYEFEPLDFEGMIVKRVNGQKYILSIKTQSKYNN